VRLSYRLSRFRVRAKYLYEDGVLFQGFECFRYGLFFAVAGEVHIEVIFPGLVAGGATLQLGEVDIPSGKLAEAVVKRAGLVL
jgi:hypothetical protein